jgi:5-methylcytosine-specific restriction enzyme A
MTRKAVLGREPICKVCDNELSTEVDHIVPLSEGGDPYRLERLQGICSPCHWMKTGGENAGVR